MAPRTVAPALPGFIHVDWLGGGGFADVFRYKDALNREVAVKVLHRGGDESAMQAFDGEALLMAKLSNHPNIVTIYQAGVSGDGRPYIVMEMCSTRHLGSRISKRPLPVARAMEYTVQIAGAVETAHRLGILHRDIKPANILFTEAGRPSLADFGISVSSDSQRAASAMSPLWAPPEQYGDAGLQMGPWSDVFSLAATTWAMLVGRSPLEVPGGQNDRLSLRARVRSFTMPPTGRQDVPDSLERVLATALAKDPRQRYQSVLEFARAIQGVQGQLSFSVTPIDVLSDEPEQYDDETDYLELGDTGTRISGFMLIDPEQTSDLTSHTSIPTGGVTTPEERSWGSTTGSSNPAVSHHGRGQATPGLRDFTGPAIPEERRPAQPGQAAESKPEQRERSKKPLLVSLVVVAIAIVGSALALPQVLNQEEPSEAAPSTKPQDPVAHRVPPVEDLTGEKKDQKVVFTWVNPDPLPGDKYLYQILVQGESSVLEHVAEESVVVDATDPKTCVSVSLRRGNGRVSESVTGCVP